MIKEKKQTEYLTLNKINVNAGLISWYVKELTKLVKVMCKVYEKKIISLYQSNKQQIEQIKYATDDSIGSQSRILLNKLNKTYNEYYDKKSKKVSESMVTKTEKIIRKGMELSIYALMDA